MRTSSGRAIGSGSLVAATMALTLLGIGATPAHAETVRDRQWHLDAMKADEMWKVSKGEGVVIAVIDSGVDKSVADLRGQVLPGKDYSLLSGDENTDIDNHGTSMAALIAGTGARGAAEGSFGLAPAAKILPIRIPYSQERWSQKNRVKETSAQSMAKAIRYAADSKAKIISISVAERKDGPELAEAVKYALGKNKLIFAGVGNSADEGNGVLYPAGTPGVVGVGGLNRKAAWWPESQSGPQVDLAAPAEGIIKACSGGTQLCDGDGTSNATALASASAALIWAEHPDWTNNQVLRVMLNTAGKPKSGEKRTDLIGYGAVRPRIALATPGDPGPADVYPLPDLAAAEPKAPSASASSGPAPAEQGKGSESDRPAAAAPAAASDSSSGTGVWIALGVGAALLVGGAVAALVVRARRRGATSAQQPPMMPRYAPSYGHQPQPAPYQQNPPYGTPPGPGQPG
ncbi:type VII secretion-associated serine protease mycosin [Streptomyces sp. QHH-9511]|uniref:type VII secretion-associated serine protease mycosin n=1 Tax=Streptomyces sp. QHH-9511 TaxID=2684468 RepID=UPI001317D348|nr:type VII secretion-associated serine protease mycosin [Streptomyces sp. QHH-9511]QGZ49178.1 type VII secretion-associated serine protease mycosin [Streptomyces sp. QHH-9511]